jgi:hypothetical protein
MHEPAMLRPDVRAVLLDHGLAPRPTTPLALVRAHLNDLYRFEIRHLRDRLRRGAFPLPEYVPRVVALRTRYRLLSLPLAHWVTPADDSCVR